MTTSVTQSLLPKYHTLVSFSLQSLGYNFTIEPHRTGQFTDDELLHRNPLDDYELVAVDPLIACQPLSNGNKHKNDTRNIPALLLHNKIALIQRGECNFVTKVIHAQEAGAAAAIIMDTEIRASNSYIIMQRDENASKVHIPAVFISYRDGEKLLLSLLRAYPWETVRVTLDDRGKMSKVSSSPWATKRVMTYAFAVSTIWLLSSCVSVLGSFLLDYLRQYLRKRAARILPVLRYHKMLRAFLIAEKAKSSTNMTKKFTVLDRMLLTAQSPSFRDEKAWLFSISINDLAHYKITSKNPVDHARAVASSVDLHLDAPLDDAECINDANSEHCAICLERFEFDELVKVLPCSHYFHQDCINPWLEKKSEVCPLCRQHVIITTSRFSFLFQEHAFLQSALLMLPASLLSCFLLNAMAALAQFLWQ